MIMHLDTPLIKLSTWHSFYYANTLRSNKILLQKNKYAKEMYLLR
jgi:hypothetical protein